jgi:hypothetical protein
MEQNHKKPSKLVTGAALSGAAAFAAWGVYHNGKQDISKIIIDPQLSRTTALLEKQPGAFPIGFYLAADGTIQYHYSELQMFIALYELSPEQEVAFRQHFQNIIKIANTQDFSDLVLTKVGTPLPVDAYRGIIATSRNIPRDQFAVAAEYVLGYTQDPKLLSYAQAELNNHSGADLTPMEEVEFYDTQVNPIREEIASIERENPGLRFMINAGDQLGLNTPELREASLNSTYIVTTVDNAKEVGILNQDARVAGTAQESYYTTITLSGSRGETGEQVQEIVFTHEFCHIVSQGLGGIVRYEGHNVSTNSYLFLKSLDYYRNGPHDKFWELLEYIFAGNKALWINGWGHDNIASMIELDQLRENVLDEPYEEHLVYSPATRSQIDVIEEFWATTASMAAANMTYEEVPAEFRSILETCVLPKGFDPGLYPRNIDKDSVNLITLILSLVLVMAAVANHMGWLRES